MNEVFIRRYTPVDSKNMNMGNAYQIRHILENYPDYFEHLGELSNDNCFTVVKGETIIAITGWTSSTLTKVDVGVMYFIPSKELKKEFNAAILKAFKQIVTKATEDHLRIQAECEDNDMFKRFLEHFDFEKEGVMKCAGVNGTDLHLYAKVNYEKLAALQNRLRAA